jgi:hypothetical protein
MAAVSVVFLHGRAELAKTMSSLRTSDSTASEKYSKCNMHNIIPILI